MKRGPIALFTLAALAITPIAAVGTTLVDAVLAAVEGHIVTASDVAVARALSLFGVSPSSEAIQYDDVERLITARLVVNEARWLGIGGTENEAEQAWDAAARRVGGEAVLDGWLEQAGVGRAWARAMVAADLDWRRFIDLRFRAFVFVPVDDVLAELGPGDHSPEARARVRAALEAREVDLRLGEWRAETERRVTVRRLLAPGDRVACPLPMPLVGPARSQDGHENDAVSRAGGRVAR
ncbi:MAG: hypothetical protein ACREJV_09625 [Candidatus Rokuibacteriota bacterium]